MSAFRLKSPNQRLPDVMGYAPDETRYATMPYRRAGRSGLVLPPIALGLWHNFGGGDDYGVARAIVLKSFDRGINHFDLANNYGPPPGSAETTFGRILSEDLAPYRDELTITTKAAQRVVEFLRIHIHDTKTKKSVFGQRTLGIFKQCFSKF